MSSVLPRADIPSGDRAGGLWMDFGGGYFGPRLRSEAPYCAVIPSVCNVIGDGSSILGTAECRSTLQATANGYEGLGLWVMAVDRTGKVVWHNNPVTSGNLDYWVTDLPTSWGRVSIPVTIPREFRTPFLACAFVVKGAAGYVDLNTAAYRTHYSQRYTYEEGPTTLANWVYQVEPQIYLGNSTVVAIRYLSTQQVSILKGQKYNVEWEMDFQFFAAASVGNPNLACFILLGLKLLYSDGTVGWDTRWVLHGESSYPPQKISSSHSPTARKQIVQIERAIVCQRRSNQFDFETVLLDHQGIRTTIEIVEQVAPGAEA